MIPKRIILHCSATTNGKSVSVEEIRSWHLERGFKDIGYHLVIDVDGTVGNGRGLNQEGAHCEGENYDSIGICLVGTDRFSKAQFVSLEYKLKSIFLTYDIPKWAIYGHYQFPSAMKQGKTCPNMDANRVLTWYQLQSDEAIAPYFLSECSFQ